MKQRMLSQFSILALGFGISGLTSIVSAQTPEANLSLKLEIQRSLDRGLRWLAKEQDAATGSLGDKEQPAITALAVSAWMADPSRPKGEIPEPAAKGYDFIASTAHDDGGFYVKGLATYNTSLSMMALLQEESGKFNQLILGGRRFLIGQQADFDNKGETDSPFDGGIGYGGSYTHSDLSNTHFALEALHYSKSLFADTGVDTSKQPDLNWDAAIKFVERCQNLTSTNDMDWASDDAANKGGFVYFPGDSKAGEITVKGEDGERVALRSYGSMSYAGLLSLVYADLKADDPRIQAVLDWLRKNFTLEENPGLELQGLYYYYHTMAKALNIAKIDKMQLSDGTRVDWREELAKKLFNLQAADGSWANTNARWMEKEPTLATAYALLTLEHIHSAL
ncbi:MAG: cycloartenol synthase [Verrucomicrobiae bacterium]|nr:cycloartenol synthase [Verrucomicrobiae bacterium]